MSNVEPHTPSLMEKPEFLDIFNEPHFQLIIFDHIQSQKLAKLRIPFSRIPIIKNNEH